MRDSDHVNVPSVHRRALNNRYIYRRCSSHFPHVISSYGGMDNEKEAEMRYEPCLTSLRRARQRRPMHPASQTITNELNSVLHPRVQTSFGLTTCYAVLAVCCAWELFCGRALVSLEIFLPRARVVNPASSSIRRERPKVVEIYKNCAAVLAYIPIVA